jgi:hypothetical protein
VTKGAGYDDWKKKQLSPEDKKKQLADWWDTQKGKKQDIDNLPSSEIPQELRPSGPNYRVEAEKARLRDKISAEQEFIDTHGDRLSSDQIKGIKTQLDNTKTQLDNVEINDKKLDLPHIPMKDNTHTKNTKGFIHDKTKISIQKSVTDNPGSKLMHERVKSAWNTLPDEHRNLVDKLVIKQSRATKGSTWRGGSYDGLTKTLSINLNSRSQENIEHNFYHEIGHARWHDLNKKSPEKISKFRDEMKKIGIAPTKYSESYRFAERRNADSEKTWRAKMKKGGWEINTLHEEQLKHNRDNSESIYHNESHSELNSYVLGNMPKKKINASPETMKKLLNAYKELHEL